MASSISVAVRVRPFSEKERALINTTSEPAPTLFLSDPSSSSSAAPVQSQAQRLGVPSQHRKILKVLDERILVFDPPDSNVVATFQKNNLPLQGKKVKDIRFCFDRVFDDHCGQEEVYEGSAKELVGHVMDGFHSTVFAYGATGCGKTHTISGSPTRPGIVFLIMKDLFARIGAKSDEVDFSLSVSYLEVYNETIRDLLAPESGVLQLRDAPDGTATPAKLSAKEPTCAQDVVEWITLGNGNRTVNYTEANATSSRSHAVLRVTVTQKPRAEGLTDSTTSACLSVIDLAGSERASNTKNRGERLTEGANINRSLLALGNCINALCDPRKRGHVPYRDSKLTRLLKQSLGGNCKTVMIVCVSPSSSHYDETHNTLQYANRAKEIKTKAIRNVISVDRHVAQYCQQIMRQSQEIERLKSQLSAQQVSSARNDREEDESAVRQAVAKVHSAWETGRLLKMASAGAAAEKEMVDQAVSILLQWQSTALSALEGGSPGGASTAAALATTSLLQQESHELVNQFKSRVNTLRSMIAQDLTAMDAFTRTLSSAQASLRANRPSATALFACEAKQFDSRLDAFVAEAREEGSRRGFRVQTQAMRKMLEASSKIGSALESSRLSNPDATRALARLAKGIEQANQTAFSLFSGDAEPGLPGGVSSISTPIIAGMKRDSASRSPLVAEDVWGKVARQSAVGIGSAPSGPLSPLRARRSPRKDASFHAARRAAQSPKKAKGVQWRDETGDGWELEDVKYNTPDSSTTAFPALTITPPTSQMWTSSSTHASSSDSALAAEMMAAKARSSSITSALRTARPPVTSDPSAPFSFLPQDSSSQSTTTDSVVSRSPFLDLANTSLAATESSFSMAPGSTGLVAPIVATTKPAESSLDVTMAPAEEALSPGRRVARRISNIGPLRSAKTTRRPSFAGLPAIDANTSISSASAGSNGLHARKAGRIVSGPAAIPATSSTNSAKPANAIPSSTRKSPRKLLSNLIGGGAASRRLSNFPGSSSSQGLAAASGILPTAPVATTFGQKSAARIAARRASNQTGSGNNSGSSLTLGGKSIASALGTTKKDSPSQPPVWR
ncbi:kinesin family protein [Sporobolomyces koalae]|uniref:kinesin family protein n=1 Tax=Sporobolomyces koalae TaxID=500713 RepID=UPI0031733414